MKTQLKNYQSPSTAISRVQLESAICDGSATYKGPETEGVVISGQEVDNSTTNDWTADEWIVKDNTTTN